MLAAYAGKHGNHHPPCRVDSAPLTLILLCSHLHGTHSSVQQIDGFVTLAEHESGDWTLFMSG